MSNKVTFVYALDAKVRIKGTAFEGVVVGSSVYSDGSANMHWVKYVGIGGALVREWYHDYDLVDA